VEKKNHWESRGSVARFSEYARKFVSGGLLKGPPGKYGLLASRADYVKGSSWGGAVSV